MKRIAFAVGLVLLGQALFTPLAEAGGHKKNGQKKAARQEAKAEKQTKSSAAPAQQPKPPAAENKAPTAGKTPPAVDNSAPSTASEGSTSASLDPQLSNQPTKIEAKTLTLFTKDRKFVYDGDVKVVQGDMTLTSRTLEGTYDDNNKIQTITALKDVVVLKGEKMKATGQRAEYEAKSNTVMMKENPKLEQDGSELTADIIRIFLKEDRSTAEGNVRVTLVNKDGKAGDLKGMIK